MKTWWRLFVARVERDPFGFVLLVLNLWAAVAMAHLASLGDASAGITLCINLLAVAVLGHNFAEPVA